MIIFTWEEGQVATGTFQGESQDPCEDVESFSRQDNLEAPVDSLVPP